MPQILQVKNIRIFTLGQQAITLMGLTPNVHCSGMMFPECGKDSIDETLHCQ